MLSDGAKFVNLYEIIFPVRKHGRAIFTSACLPLQPEKFSDRLTAVLPVDSQLADLLLAQLDHIGMSILARY